MGYCYKVTIAPTQKEFEDDGYEYEVGLFLNKQTAMGATIDALDESDLILEWYKNTKMTDLNSNG